MLNEVVALEAHLAEAVAGAVAEEDGLAADHHLEVAAHIPMADMAHIPTTDIIILKEPLGAEIPKVWSGARQITITVLLWSQSLVELAPIIKGMDKNAQTVVLFIKDVGLQMNAHLLPGGMSLSSSPLWLDLLFCSFLTKPVEIDIELSIFKQKTYLW